MNDIFIKYLYLAKVEYAATWIAGGEVPLSLASSYKASERSGTQTPDENLIHRSPVDLKSLKAFGIDIVNARNVTMTGNRFNGSPMPDLHNAHHYLEDGLVLCLCNSPDSSICNRLDKVIGITIPDIRNLKRVFDAQLGVESVAQACKYTDGHERDHFLKSSADAWQDEFRLFWPIAKASTVTLPPGLARPLDLTKC